MKLQNGMLIQFTEKNKYVTKHPKNAIVLEQITEDHRYYIHDCGYYQYLIITNNTIQFLGFLPEAKSWCIASLSDFHFDDDILHHVSYNTAKVKFHDEATNKWKLLRKPPAIDRWLYIREQHQRELANKDG